MGGKAPKGVKCPDEYLLPSWPAQKRGYDDNHVLPDPLIYWGPLCRGLWTKDYWRGDVAWINIVTASPLPQMWCRLSNGVSGNPPTGPARFVKEGPGRDPPPPLPPWWSPRHIRFIYLGRRDMWHDPWWTARVGYQVVPLSGPTLCTATCGKW